MATNKIKFKMSIEKIVFDYEGDFDKGQALQQGITQAMTGLANLQNRALGTEEINPNRKLIDSKPVDQAPHVPRRRPRRRRTAGADGVDGAAQPNGDGNGDGEAGGGDGERRSTGVSPIALVMELRTNGFFDQQRTSGDVLNELHRKGYSMLRANGLTYPLQKLAQKDVLRRDHSDEKNQWVYTKGTKDEV